MSNTRAQRKRPPGDNVSSLIQPMDALGAAFLDCHSDGHQWHHEAGVLDPINAESGMRPPWGQQTARGRRSVCTSCGGERVRWYTRSGEVVNRYRMLDGYYHKRSDPDDAAPTRREWRQRLVVTLFADFTGNGEADKPKRKRAAKAAAS